MTETILADQRQAALRMADDLTRDAQKLPQLSEHAIRLRRAASYLTLAAMELDTTRPAGWRAQG